jgi:hypothetical protein
MKRQSVHFQWNEPQITNHFSSAVSLHSHTDYSHESFTGIHKYAEDSILLRLVITRVSSWYRKATSKELDFPRAYYVPPMSPALAYRLEARQIETLGLHPMVSITDHDTIDGAKRLQPFVEPATVPISLEWTVPFGPSFFHVGIHNLPQDRASEIADGLRDVQCSFCRNLKASCIGAHDGQCFPKVQEWIEHISALPNTLTVLNHPLWDVSGFGESAHRKLLSSFLARYGQWIHALELNGLRTWDENRNVMAIADQWKMPLVSGGDRHGREANAVVNLTSVETFSEFTEQVRANQSTVLFLRQYRYPLSFRKLRIAWEVVKTSHDSSGARTRWNDRVFIPWLDGRVLPLSSQEWLSTLADEPMEASQPTV